MIELGPVLALLLSLPPCYSERNDPARIEHIAIQAHAIAVASASLEDAAALLTIGSHESAWCWSVATGAKHGGDGWGPWQLEPGSRRKRPFIGADIASLSHAAGEALWLWHHSWQCGPGLRERFKAYAGLRCGSQWAGAASRARFYPWVLWQLRQWPGA